MTSIWTRLHSPRSFLPQRASLRHSLDLTGRMGAGVTDDQKCCVISYFKITYIMSWWTGIYGKLIKCFLSVNKCGHDGIVLMLKAWCCLTIIHRTTVQISRWAVCVSAAAGCENTGKESPHQEQCTQANNVELQQLADWTHCASVSPTQEWNDEMSEETWEMFWFISHSDESSLCLGA